MRKVAVPLLAIALLGASMPSMAARPFGGWHGGWGGGWHGGGFRGGWGGWRGGGWHGGGWGWGGFGPGLVAGAVIGGLAARPYAYPYPYQIAAYPVYPPPYNYAAVEPVYAEVPSHTTIIEKKVYIIKKEAPKHKYHHHHYKPRRCNCDYGRDGDGGYRY